MSSQAITIDEQDAQLVDFCTGEEHGEREILRLIREQEANDEKAAQDARRNECRARTQKASPVSERVLRKTIRMTPGSKERTES